MARAHGDLEIAEFGEGGGIPVVLLHEGLGSVGMWRNFPRELAKTTGRRVITWSRRGYGWSGDFAQAYDADFMHREAAAAAEVLERLDISRAHVFGHSDGASIALLLAALYPQLAESLILEAPHVIIEPFCIDAIAALAGSGELPDFLARLGKYHRNAPQVFEQWSRIWLDPAFRTWSIEADIASIAIPVLMIQGEQDQYGTFAQLDRIAALLPQARQLRLPDCRHSPHRDQQDAVLTASARFLAQLDLATNCQEYLHE